MGELNLAKEEIRKDAILEVEIKHGVLQGKYELGRLLGQGTFARVYHARNVQTGKSVAMKVVGKDKVIKAKMMEQVKREISVMKRVKHPNIVELYEVMATKSKVYLAMELVRGGEFFTKISKNGKLDEDLARTYFRQLISAVGYCHSQGVYHRDLKLENLLLDHQGNLKVSDFGLSTYFEDSDQMDRMLRTSCGTPHYVAPEVVSKRGQGYDGAKADIWSCGVILYVLLAGYLPFNDDNLMTMYRKIYKADFKCPSWFSPQSRDLITRMIDPKPKSRIKISEIMSHEWFTASQESDSDLNLTDNWANNDKVVKNKEPEEMNAFHIISLSRGLDLSALFEEKRKEREEVIFTTKEAASKVISRLEEVVAKAGEGAMRMPGNGKGGKLAIAAELYSLSSSFLVVEVKLDSGDRTEFNQFCHSQLRPALQDMVWTAC
ncbi:CBL-interacting serine/threonine-protein kinase 6-like [Silene latifolia]|uniref:CBL-interacting serine/threonine-protein kinase 6-like n=1 Tax=Silene latifolia TaxID=37657 RepID=UPI003D77964A